jgi:hypothetical protein
MSVRTRMMGLWRSIGHKGQGFLWFQNDTSSCILGYTASRFLFEAGSFTPLTDVHGTAFPNWEMPGFHPSLEWLTSRRIATRVHRIQSEMNITG